MAICKFFQSGHCRFGAQCRNEHPGQVTAANTSNRGNYNDVPRGNYNDMPRGNYNDAPRGNYNDVPRGPAGGRNNQANNSFTPNRRYPANLEPEAIRQDLTSERPIWPFSNYAPNSQLPRQLFGKNVELSAEEMRVQFYRDGPQAAGSVENQLNNEIQSGIARVLSDIPGAIQFLVDGQNQHPNRLDEVQQNTLPSAQRGIFAVGAQPQRPQSINGTAFGQPSGFGAQQKTTFGQPSAFGGQQQQPQPQRAAFGQQPAFGGQRPTTFGQPSGLVAQQSTTFGQPSGVSGGQRPAFGQPGHLNQASPFGNQGTPSTQAPSSFGQPSFGGAAPGPFNQPQPGPNGASPFAALQNQNQPSSNGIAINDTSMQSPSAPSFPQNTLQTQATAFNQPSPFGQPSQPSTTFGQPSQPSTTFGQPSQPANPFGQPPPQPSPFSKPNPSKNSTLRLTVDSEKRAFTIENGKQRRVFFPEGPPAPSADLEPALEEYGGQEGATAVEQVYKVAIATGQWPGGVVPEEAPLIGWNDYDV